jgi:hypothetical protein
MAAPATIGIMVRYSGQGIGNGFRTAGTPHRKWLSMNWTCLDEQQVVQGAVKAAGDAFWAKANVCAGAQEFSRPVVPHIRLDERLAHRLISETEHRF